MSACRPFTSLTPSQPEGRRGADVPLEAAAHPQAQGLRHPTRAGRGSAPRQRPEGKEQGGGSGSVCPGTRAVLRSALTTAPLLVFGRCPHFGRSPAEGLSRPAARSFPTETVEVNGTSGPAGTCLGRLLPAEGMDSDFHLVFISILDLARARVRGKTSAEQGADVTRDGAAPRRAVGRLVYRGGSPLPQAWAEGSESRSPPAAGPKWGLAVLAGHRSPRRQGCRGGTRLIEHAVGAEGKPSLPSAPKTPLGISARAKFPNSSK